MRASFGGPLFCLTHHLYRPEEEKDDTRRAPWCSLEPLPRSAIAQRAPSLCHFSPGLFHFTSSKVPSSLLGHLSWYFRFSGSSCWTILVFIISFFFFFLGQVIPNLYDVGINPCPFLICHPNTSRLYKCHGMHNIYFWKHPNDFFFQGSLVCVTFVPLAETFEYLRRVAKPDLGLGTSEN